MTTDGIKSSMTPSQLASEEFSNFLSSGSSKAKKLEERIYREPCIPRTRSDQQASRELSVLTGCTSSPNPGIVRLKNGSTIVAKMGTTMSMENDHQNMEVRKTSPYLPLRKRLRPEPHCAMWPETILQPLSIEPEDSQPYTTYCRSQEIPPSPPLLSGFMEEAGEERHGVPTTWPDSSQESPTATYIEWPNQDQWGTELGSVDTISNGSVFSMSTGTDISPTTSFCLSPIATQSEWREREHQSSLTRHGSYSPPLWRRRSALPENKRI